MLINLSKLEFLEDNLQFAISQGHCQTHCKCNNILQTEQDIDVIIANDQYEIMYDRLFTYGQQFLYTVSRERHVTCYTFDAQKPLLTLWQTC